MIALNEYKAHKEEKSYTKKLWVKIKPVGINHLWRMAEKLES